MKTLVTALALVAFVATPVLAQSARNAPKSTRGQVQKHAANPKWDVYVNGKYVGSDPDAFIRGQLMSDPEHGGNDAGGGE